MERFGTLCDARSMVPMMNAVKAQELKDKELLEEAFNSLRAL